MVLFGGITIVTVLMFYVEVNSIDDWNKPEYTGIV